MTALDSIPILFENAEFVAVDKPAGMLSVPSRFAKEDPRKVLGLELERQLNLRLYPIHRLDAEVSGLILFAKTPNAHRDANRAFENHWVQKTYQAWTEGPPLDNIPLGSTQTWECLLLRGKKRAYESPVGKKSITHATFQGVSTFGELPVLRWLLSPQSGRSHQLRYELYRHKRPILGDTLYGSTVDFRPNAIALRAVALNVSAAHEKGLLKSLPATLEAPYFAQSLVTE